MPNRNYLKGVRKERKIVNEAREKGMVAFRSAGSHSPIDVCIIDLKNKTITFVQSKPDSWPDWGKKNYEDKDLSGILKGLNGYFKVLYRVM